MGREGRKGLGMYAAKKGKREGEHMVSHTTAIMGMVMRCTSVLLDSEGGREGKGI